MSFDSIVLPAALSDVTDRSRHWYGGDFGPNHSWAEMFQRASAWNTVSWGRNGPSLSWWASDGPFLDLRPAAKTGGISGGGGPGRHFGGILPACGGRLRIRASENRLAVAPTMTSGFSLKWYRKGTRLVQEHSLSAWIWRGWNGRQNVGCSDRTLTPAVTSDARRNSRKVGIRKRRAGPSPSRADF
jgi:hypothetical protein